MSPAPAVVRIRLFSRFFGLLALFLSIALPLVTPSNAAAEPASIRRFALVIGANNGGNSRVLLRYANSDARRISAVLKGFGGVSGNDLVVINEATPEAIRASFERLNLRIAHARERHRRVELIVYYSGHSDETGLLPSGGRISWAELRSELKRTPADVRIAILDSCASGALIRGKGGIRRSPFMMDQSSQVKGHAYLTSSSANEVAQESDRIGASYFTHHLVTGLRGAADVNNDRRVTLSEAYQYAFHQTLARTEKTRKGPQHPNYDFELAGSGDVVITALHRSASTMLFAKPMAGRVFIRNQRGHLVAELSKLPGRRIELGLPPGKYRVGLHDDDGVHTADVELQRGTRAPLERKAFTTVKALEPTRSRGGPDATVVQGPKRPESLINVQLVPGLSLIGVRSGTKITKLSLNILGGVNGGLSGVEAASLFNIQLGPMEGGQYAGVFNAVAGNVDGVQGAGVFNSADGNVRGVQVAGVANVAKGSMLGVQFAPAVNLTTGSVDGGQFGMVNIAGGGVSGAQVGVVNLAGDKSEAAQVAVLNVSGDMKGVQAGIVNIVDDAEGAQVGILNIADEAKGARAGLVNVSDVSRGVQVGLVNVAVEGDGHAIGLLNFIGNGYNRFEAWTSDTSAFNAGIKFGSKWMYTVVTAGISERDKDRYMQASLGWGTHVAFGKYYMDIDALAGFAIESEDRMESRVDVLSKLRLTFGRFLGRHLAVFGGIALNTAIGFDERQPRALRFGALQTIQLDDQTTMAIGPGLFAGLSI